jgi:hypothetical protein
MRHGALEVGLMFLPPVGSLVDYLAPAALRGGPVTIPANGTIRFDVVNVAATAIVPGRPPSIERYLPAGSGKYHVAFRYESYDSSQPAIQGAFDAPEVTFDVL